MYPARAKHLQVPATGRKGTSDDTLTVPDLSEQFLRINHDHLIQTGTCTPISENRIEKNIHTMLT